jgi:hypothetical protein
MGRGYPQTHQHRVIPGYSSFPYFPRPFALIRSNEGGVFSLEGAALTHNTPERALIPFHGPMPFGPVQIHIELGKRANIREVWVNDKDYMKDHLRWLEEAGKWPGDYITLDAVRKRVRQANKPPKQREPCAICGRWARISQAHHFVSVGFVAKFLHSVPIFDWVPKIPFVFLCPNHHALWHEMDRIGADRLHELLPEFKEHELDKLIELSGRRDKVREEVLSELRREWKARSGGDEDRKDDVYSPTT